MSEDTSSDDAVEQLKRISSLAVRFLGQVAQQHAWPDGEVEALAGRIMRHPVAEPGPEVVVCAHSALRWILGLVRELFYEGNSEHAFRDRSAHPMCQSWKG